MECATCHRPTLKMRLKITVWAEGDLPMYVQGQTFTVKERLPGDVIRATDHSGEHLFDLEYCEFGRWEKAENPNFQVWKPLPAPEPNAPTQVVSCTVDGMACVSTQRDDITGETYFSIWDSYEYRHEGEWDSRRAAEAVCRSMNREQRAIEREEEEERIRG